MKQNKFMIKMLAICLLFVGCFSCGPFKEKIFEPAMTDAKLFQLAEDKYQQKIYREALSLYEDYARKFPDSDRSPQVFLRMGQIQMELQQYARAQGLFNRVMDQYPNSPSATDAMIENLRAMYFTAKYQEVLKTADKVLTSVLSAEQSVKFHLVVGDSYLALKSPVKAYQEFITAMKNATPRDAGPIMLRVKTVIPLLSAADLRFELKQTGDQPPAGYLMFQLGRQYLAEGKKDEAASTFEKFLSKFPDHEYAAEAQKIIGDMQAPPVPVEQKAIGCLLPLSGKYESFGQQALKGVELALTIFSREQGTVSINIHIKDTASQPATAEKMISDLKESNVIGIIGPVAASEASAAKAQEFKIPIVTLTQKSNMTDAGDYVFRNFLTPEMQVKTLIQYAIGTLNISRFAILYPDDGYGNSFMKLFKDESLKAGGTVTNMEAYPPGAKDFEASVKKLIGYSQWRLKDKNTVAADSPDTEPAKEIQEDQEAGSGKKKEEIPVVNFDAIFIPDSPEKAGLIIPLFAYYGVRNIYLLGTNLWHSEKMIQMTESQVQGAVIPDGFFDNAASENVSRFVAEFEAAYGYRPGFIEAVSYDTAMILFNLAAAPDVKTADDMKRKLISMPPYPGVTGTTYFSSNGEAVKDIYLLKIISGRFAEIYYK